MTGNTWVEIAGVIVLGAVLGFLAFYAWDRYRRRRRSTATYLRQAAALLLHWRDNDERAVEGVMAVLKPLPRGSEWVDLTCALLLVASQALTHARDGTEVEYLRQVATGAALEEMGDDD
jgi:hypothetical protein